MVAKSQQSLLARYTQSLEPGTLAWIGLRPARRAPVVAVARALAIEGRGLEGDHRCDKTPGSGRQITLISQEYIGQIEHFSGYAGIQPEQLRRNLVVRDINLALLRHQTFRIGEALFEATSLAHPCSRMEDTIGPGAVAAMFGHGGLCATILRGGEIALGNAVQLVTTPEE